MGRNVLAQVARAHLEPLVAKLGEQLVVDQVNLTQVGLVRMRLRCWDGGAEVGVAPDAHAGDPVVGAHRRPERPSPPAAGATAVGSARADDANAGRHGELETSEIP